MSQKPPGHTRRIIDQWARARLPSTDPAIVEDLVQRIEEWIDGLMAVQRIRATLLEEQLASARGEPKPYRVINRKTGEHLDLDTADRVMDHLFAVGGIDALRRFWVYKHRRQVKMPGGGEVGEIARWLDQQ